MKLILFILLINYNYLQNRQARVSRLIFGTYPVLVTKPILNMMQRLYFLAFRVYPMIAPRLKRTDQRLSSAAPSTNLNHVD